MRKLCGVNEAQRSERSNERIDTSYGLPGYPANLLFFDVRRQAVRAPTSILGVPILARTPYLLSAVK